MAMSKKSGLQDHIPICKRSRWCSDPRVLKSASGGGNVPNLDLNRFGPSLRWMSYEAIRAGLRMKPFQGIWQTFQPSSSMNGYWRLLEHFPLPIIRRLSYQAEESKEHSVCWRVPYDLYIYMIAVSLRACDHIGHLTGRLRDK
jgi:hypothetical protein